MSKKNPELLRRSVKSIAAMGVGIAVEVGIQNSTLAVGLSMLLTDDPAVMTPAIVYSLLIYLTGSVVVTVAKLSSP